MTSQKFNINKIEKAPNGRVRDLINQLIYGNNSSQKPIILLGAGAGGIYYLNILQKISKAKFLFCDNDTKKNGTKVSGIEVISFEVLKKIYDNHHIIITSLNYYDEILQQLEENNMKEIVTVNDILGLENYQNYFNVIRNNFDKFSQTYDILADKYSKNIFYERLNYCITLNSNYLISYKSKHPQYFEPDIMNLSQEEIFIDGGAYTGDTVEEFIKQTGGIYKKIYSFEPEKNQQEEFLNKFLEINKIELVPYGLWNKREIIRFNAENDASSGVDFFGNTEVEVISIDEFLNGDVATFIKMDIEGAELEALQGAENTIKEYKPNLAICVYHKPLDIINIPLYLKSIVPEYNIHLRHYSTGITETVCYATIKK